MNGIKKSINCKHSPLVSIVTTSYNQGRFIEETIKSVLDQDYTNIEYIVIDGGSTDNTLEILKRYEDKLKWVSGKDNGPEDAINKGLKIARGEIFGWINSDDTYLPGAIVKVVNFFNCQIDVKMVYGKAYFTDKEGKVIGPYFTEPFNFKRLAISSFIPQPATFVRREIFNEVGGYPLYLQYATDYDLWMRIAQRFKIEHLPDFLATYRLHKESRSMSDQVAVTLSKEFLMTTMRYHHWAPANRVYRYCYYLVKSKIPLSFVWIRPFSPFLALIISCKEYLRLNRGIRLDDIRLINLMNVKKLFMAWKLKNRGTR